MELMASKSEATKTTWTKMCRSTVMVRAAFLAILLPRVMKEGESKKAALILMKNSHFDRTLR